MTRNRILGVGIFAAVIFVCVGLAIALSVVTVTRTHSVIAAGLQMPHRDREFESWLNSQPGVIGGSVSISRNHNNNLKISLQMSQNIYGFPKFPDVDAKCSKMGYRFKTERFVPDGGFD